MSPESNHPRPRGASRDVIKAIGDAYAGQSVAEVRAAIVVSVNHQDLETSEDIPVVAQRIVDGHRGEDIFDY